MSYKKKIFSLKAADDNRSSEFIKDILLMYTKATTVFGSARYIPKSLRSPIRSHKLYGSDLFYSDLNNKSYYGGDVYIGKTKEQRIKNRASKASRKKMVVVSRRINRGVK